MLTLIGDRKWRSPHFQEPSNWCLHCVWLIFITTIIQKSLCVAAFDQESANCRFQMQILDLLGVDNKFAMWVFWASPAPHAHQVSKEGTYLKNWCPLCSGQTLWLVVGRCQIWVIAWRHKKQFLFQWIRASLLVALMSNIRQSHCHLPVLSNSAWRENEAMPNQMNTCMCLCDF